MHALRLAVLLISLSPIVGMADDLASWAPHDTQMNWQPLTNTHGTDVYINVQHEGRIADIRLKSGIYDATHQLTQVNIIEGYFGCPEGELPQYLEHAKSVTYDAIRHSPAPSNGPVLNDENVPVTEGSVIESAAKWACADTSH